MKHGNWTVIFTDKMIYKKTGDSTIESAKSIVIDDDSFWNQAKFSNLHAIQFTDDSTDNDQVEYNDGTENGLYDVSVLGSFDQFKNKFDAAWLTHIQSSWDDDTIQVEDPAGSGTYRDETSAEKITRLGARPTSYSS